MSCSLVPPKYNSSLNLEDRMQVIKNATVIKQGIQREDVSLGVILDTILYYNQGKNI